MSGAYSWIVERKGKPLGKWQHEATSGTLIVISLALSSLGIVALIGAVYDILVWGFFFTFILPLFTVGAYKAWKNFPQDQVTERKTLVTGSTERQPVSGELILKPLLGACKAIGSKFANGIHSAD